jgi:hypothetical protein
MMTHTYSVIGAVDGFHDDRISFKSLSVNVTIMPGFRGGSLPNSVNWLRPWSRSNYTFSAMSMFQLLAEWTTKGLDMASWSEFSPEPFCNFLVFLLI